MYTPESSAEEDTLDRQTSGQGKSKKKFGLRISPKLTLNKQIWEASDSRSESGCNESGSAREPNVPHDLLMRARDAAWTPFPSYLSPVPDGLRKVLPPAEEQPRAAENGENGEGYRRVRVGVRGRLPILRGHTMT